MPLAKIHILEGRYDDQRLSNLSKTGQGLAQRASVSAPVEAVTRSIGAGTFGTS